MRVLISIFFVLFHAGTASAQGSYRLQPGDTVEIWVGQDANLNRNLIVGPDGRISMPLAGHLQASGLTLQQLERSLKSRLQKNFTTDLDLTVMIATPIVPEDAERIVYLTGEIGRPGPLVLNRPTTVLQAIAMAGGMGQFAAKKRVQIRRTINGEQVLLPFNYRDVERGRILLGDIFLQDGDVIVVPERGLFE